jgi:hypothetical protein
MEDKPTTVRETKTVAHVATQTVAKVVEKPYIHPLTYVITAAAVAAILAAYLTRRSKPTAQR